MTDLNVLQGKVITFIGGGNMATALIDGLLSVSQRDGLGLTIQVSDPNQDNLANLAKKGIVTSLPSQANKLMASSDVVVLAVKPQVMSEVVAEIREFFGNQLIISVAAGVNIEKLSHMTGSQRVVRTMPNLPATVGFGATGLYCTLGDDDKKLASAIMGASGVTAWVDKEDDLNAVTAVAGSAPAYFFYVLEHMIDKAVAMGLDRDDAKALAVQTMQGAAIMSKSEDVAELRAKVTSKGGTTHAAITAMQSAQVGEHIANAMQACYDRSVELGK